MKKVTCSHWTTAGLAHSLREFRRLDDGTDNLAFSIAGDCANRSAYIYLYGDDPFSIHYDLEDASVDTGSWDHAVRRGSARSIEELRWIVSDWFAQEFKDLEPVLSAAFSYAEYRPLPFESDR